MSLRPEDICTEIYPAPPTTGMRVGMGSQGIRVIHKPTGLSAESTSERSQHANRQIALDELEVLVAATHSTPEDAEIARLTARLAECEAAVDQAVALVEYLEGHSKGEMAKRVTTALSASFALERAAELKRLREIETATRALIDNVEIRQLVYIDELLTLRDLLK